MWFATDGRHGARRRQPRRDVAVAGPTWCRSLTASTTRGRGPRAVRGRGVDRPDLARRAAGRRAGARPRCRRRRRSGRDRGRPAPGAGRVVAVCRRRRRVRGPAATGAHAVVTLRKDRRRGRAAAADDRGDGRTADVVVDPVFGWVAALRTGRLAPRGRLVNLGGSAGGAAPSCSRPSSAAGPSSVLGYTNNALTPDKRAEALTSVLALAATGGSLRRAPRTPPRRGRDGVGGGGAQRRRPPPGPGSGYPRAPPRAAPVGYRVGYPVGSPVEQPIGLPVGSPIWS